MKNLICGFVSGPRKLWNLICTLKGVNKFDGESYFTAKKYTRIIVLFAEKEQLSLDDALCFFTTQRFTV